MPYRLAVSGLMDVSAAKAKTSTPTQNQGHSERECVCVQMCVCVPGYILSKLRRVWRIELDIEGKLPVVVCRERERDERERARESE